MTIPNFHVLVQVWKKCLWLIGFFYFSNKNKNKKSKMFTKNYFNLKILSTASQPNCFFSFLALNYSMTHYMILSPFFLCFLHWPVLCYFFIIFYFFLAQNMIHKFNVLLFSFSYVSCMISYNMYDNLYIYIVFFYHYSRTQDKNTLIWKWFFIFLLFKVLLKCFNSVFDFLFFFIF